MGSCSGRRRRCCGRLLLLLLLLLLSLLSCLLGCLLGSLLLCLLLCLLLLLLLLSLQPLLSRSSGSLLLFPGSCCSGRLLLLLAGRSLCSLVFRVPQSLGDDVLLLLLSGCLSDLDQKIQIRKNTIDPNNL